MNNSYHGANALNNALPFFSSCSGYIPPFDTYTAHLPRLYPRMADPCNQNQMKQIAQQIRFKERMQVINQKKGKYKRSTNNCHKKYIGILKNLLLLKLDQEPKNQLLENYYPYRNTRAYYFIILSYIKWYLQVADVRWVYQHFRKQVEVKISRYKLEISTTNNGNFINFRRDEIMEMNYSIQTINMFLMDNEQGAIRLLYQKNKYIIIKKNQYLRTLQLIGELRNRLKIKMSSLDFQAKLNKLKLDEVFQVKKEDTEKYINYNNLQNQRQQRFDSRPENLHSTKRIDVKQQEQRSQYSYFSNGLQDKLNQQLLKPNNSQKIAFEKLQQEESFQEQLVKKYPLITLQNSYPTIDSITWHTWQLHKQKKFEFCLRIRESMTNNNNHSNIWRRAYK